MRPKKARGSAHSVRTEQAYGQFLGLREIEDPSRQIPGTFQVLESAETSPKALEKRLGFDRAIEGPISGQPRVKYLKVFRPGDLSQPPHFLIGGDDGTLHAVPAVPDALPHWNEISDILEAGDDIPPPIDFPVDPTGRDDPKLKPEDVNGFRSAIKLAAESGKYTPAGSSTPYTTEAGLLNDAIGQAAYTNPSPISAVSPIDVKELTRAVQGLRYSNASPATAATGDYEKAATGGGWPSTWAAMLASAPVLSATAFTRAFSPPGFTYSARVVRIIRTFTPVLPDSDLWEVGSVYFEGSFTGVSNVIEGAESGIPVPVEYYLAAGTDPSNPALWSDLSVLLGTLTFPSPSGAVTKTDTFKGAFDSIRRNALNIIVARIQGDVGVPPTPLNTNFTTLPGGDIVIRVQMTRKNRRLPNYGLAFRIQE